MQKLTVINNPTDLKISSFNETLSIFISKEEKILSNFNIIYAPAIIEKEYLYFNINNSFSIVLDTDLHNAFIFILEQFYIDRKPDINKSYEILLLTEKLNVENSEQFYFTVFNIIGWNSNRKGLDYFKALKNMAEELRNMILNKKVSIVEGVLFHNYFKNDYCDFIRNLPGNMTFSENNQILRFVTEICKRNNLTIKDIYPEINFKDKTVIIESLFRLRYPNYSAIKRKFEDFIKETNIPASISYDDTFEKEEYTLTITFNTLKNLSQKTNKIKNCIDNLITSNIKDYFDQKVLFNEKEIDKN